MTLATVDNVNDIRQKEEVHKTEFNSIITQIENNILELSSRINDCDLITKTLWVNYLCIIIKFIKNIDQKYVLTNIFIICTC